MTIPILFANNATSNLAGAITPTSVSVSLTSGTGALFPNPGAGQYFDATFNDAATGLLREVMHVTAVVGDTFTIVRAQEGTVAQNWAAGDICAALITAGALSSFMQANAPYGYAVDTGSHDAMVLTLAPAVTAYSDGLKIRFRVGAGNANTTTTPTVNVNGLGAITFTRENGGAMAAQDFQPGADHEATYSSATATFLVTTLPPWASGSQIYQAAGSNSFTVPVGVTRLRSTIWGSSGGSGGSNAGTGGGGGGGGYSDGWFAVTPGQVLTVVVGAAGTQGLANGANGGQGGTSSVNFTAGTQQSTGGGGGGSTNTTNGAGGAGGVGTSPGTSNVDNRSGQPGGAGGFATNGGGSGGSCAGGGGAGGGNTGAVPIPGVAPGGGPSGSGPGQNGSVGTVGQNLLQW